MSGPSFRTSFIIVLFQAKFILQAKFSSTPQLNFIQILSAVLYLVQAYVQRYGCFMQIFFAKVS